MHAAAALWARRLISANTNIRRVGYIGSYARGDWGPGSDIDLVILVGEAEDPLVRARGIDTLDLPVPADVLIFTEAEWDGMQGRRIRREPIVWTT